MKGYVSNIQRFSLHDGPGIRTTVFFAGCNLRCGWCHNPETFLMREQLQFFKGRCTGCGECVGLCPEGAQQIKNGLRLYDRSICSLCGRCEEACGSEALKLTCRSMDDSQVIEEILKDRAIYENTGGGVTFSGGEPFLQPEFLLEITERCSELNIRTAVETAGNVAYKTIMEVLPYIDTVIYDLKAFDRELHIKGTGVSNTMILDNLREISRNTHELWVRIPIVPGYNDNNDELSRMAEFLKTVSPSAVELIPFHKMGLSKYESLSMPCSAAGLKTHSDDEIAGYARIFWERGLNLKNIVKEKWDETSTV